MNGNNVQSPSRIFFVLFRFKNNDSFAEKECCKVTV